MKNRILIFIMSILLAGQTLVSCQRLGLKMDDASQRAFYDDTFDLRTLIRDEDPPARQAALRMMAESRENPKKRDLSGDMENAVRLDPTGGYPYYFFAKALFDEGDFAKAELIARKAYSLFGMETDESLRKIWQSKSLFLQARAREKKGDLAKANQLATEAITLDHDNPLIEEWRLALNASEKTNEVVAR